MNKSNMIIIDNYPMIKNSHTTLSALADIAANACVRGEPFDILCK